MNMQALIGRLVKVTSEDSELKGLTMRVTGVKMVDNTNVYNVIEYDVNKKPHELERTIMFPDEVEEIA